MDQSSNRSTFVTVVAWILIVVSGFATLIALLQNAMVHLVLKSPQMGQLAQAHPAEAPVFAVFTADHIGLIFFAVLVVCIVTLVSSIGLLKRVNWARWVVIALMILGVAWCLGGLAFQAAMFVAMKDQFANVPDASGMGPFLIAFAVVNVLIALAFAGLFGWIAKRLLSPGIAAEFGGAKR